MKQSLRFVSLLLLLLVQFSCSHKVTGEASTLPPIIATSEQSQRYNMQLDFRKHHFSGMLIVRQMSGDEIRILGATYFGLSLFDFSLTRGVIKVNSCIEPMQKKRILQLLERDFKNLFLSSDKARIQSQNSTFERRTSGSGFLKSIYLLSKFKEGQAEQVQIKHPLIGLTIQLNKLNDNKF